jgi:hypothetical protein
VTDFAEVVVLEVAEQDGGTVGSVKRGHGFVEERFDIEPGGWDLYSGIGMHGIHLRGEVLAVLTPGFAADDIDSGAAGDLVKPRGENGIRRKPVRLASEVHEHGLGDFLGQLWGTDLAQRGRMDQIEVAPDDFTKGVLVAVRE